MSIKQFQGAGETISVRSQMINRIDFYRHKEQKNNKLISGYDLFQELPNQKLLVNKEYLGLILAKANEVPESWQGLNLFAWKGLGPLLPLGQQVPYFFYEAGEWKSAQKWLGDNFGINDVAVISNEALLNLRTNDREMNESKKGVLA